MCESCLPAPLRMSRRGVLTLFAAAPLVVAWRPEHAHAKVAAVPVGAGLSVMPREAWAGERQPTAAMTAEDVRFLLVHHTAGANDYAANDVPSILRQIFDYHTGPDKGWPDVCYNFFVDRFGVVWEGRAGSLAGAVTPDATGGNQGFSQLVCVIGDFTSVMPTDAAVESTVRTLAWMAGRFGIDTAPTATVQFVSRGSNKWPAGETVTASTVSGHRDMSATACPGDTFYPYVVSSLRERVHASGAALGAVATTPAGTTVAPPMAPTVNQPVTAPTSTSSPTTTTTALTPSTEPTTMSESRPTAGAGGSATSASTSMETRAPARSASTDVRDARDGAGVDWAPVALVAGGVAVGAGALAARRRPG